MTDEMQRRLLLERTGRELAALEETIAGLEALTRRLKIARSEAETVLNGAIKKELSGATNTEQLRGGKQSLPDTDSTSIVTENGGFVK